MDKQLLSIIAVFGTPVWVIWLIFDLVRHITLIRSQAAAQERLLLRVSSPESLQIFLASDSGRNFLRSLERNPADAWRSIIRSAQTAVVFAVLAIGMLACHFAFPDAEGLLPFSLGAFILAAAFGASAAVSLLLHRRSGLLPANTA